MSINTQRDVVLSSQTGWWTINWGAVFASLVFIYALSWLIFTLSSAIGFSLIEVPDIKHIDTESEGLTVSFALYAWFIVTAFITYFLGGILAGKLSGNIDHRAATLHGVVVWSCTIIITVTLASMGVTNLLSSAAGAIKTTATAGTNITKAVASDREGATSQLPSSFQPLIASIKQGIRKGASQDEKKLEKAAEQIDPQALGLIATALIRGDEQQAKEIIASNTDLDEKEVDELVSSVKTKADKIGKDIQRKADEAREYAAGILWLMFISYIVALIASILGARYGAKKLASSVHSIQ
ncbi:MULTISPECIES: hypothetical protein [Nitrosomonas]|uniref:Uncharacterized protein n=2 Tax=Pseudomonadota TaxID=1224 RepID=A0A0F7KIS0_9PROT|nr:MULTISPECIES: hypothetical protein [Nitrosomonas]AKH38844.1 hypothetical protein AAW31_15195 [Nitrosomonas communis]TYP88226.1 hypothetical protein BCL69_102111 [Nitrosomonas communis]UVS60961.1 hypothetical protein NX761_15935 [Nitrosomonas sp. PLL12]